MPQRSHLLTYPKLNLTQTSPRCTCRGGNCAAAALAGCSATATGQVVDDAALTAKVKQQLFEEHKVSAASVNVTTYRDAIR